MELFFVCKLWCKYFLNSKSHKLGENAWKILAPLAISPFRCRLVGKKSTSCEVKNGNPMTNQGLLFAWTEFPKHTETA